MMDMSSLRRADFFSGGAIVVFGLFVVGQALGMPMKDSWGGVQNVWYVSPALFPLCIGSMLVLLGLLLMRTALKETGRKGIQATLAYFGSRSFARFLVRSEVIRFYAIVLLLFTFVFLLVPRVDFFLSAALFLLAFFAMFYLDSTGMLLKLMVVYGVGCVLLGGVLFLTERLERLLAHPQDFYVSLFFVVIWAAARHLTKENALARKKLRTAVTLALCAPVLIGGVFKYFLLVPMPFEGLIVEMLDAVWYADIWG